MTKQSYFYNQNIALFLSLFLSRIKAGGRKRPQPATTARNSGLFFKNIGAPKI